MRTAIRIFIRDLRRLLASPAAIVIAVGVCVIPSVYAWLNILANWDPYENTGTVPVAVAELDRGADVPGMGFTDAGDMVRQRLEENDQLGWTFVDSEEDALEGVRSGRYFAAFVIPEDFTSTLAGVLDGRTEPARVGYYVNEKANAVAPKVTDTGATTLETQIAQEFVSVAGETVTERLQGAVRGATDAADAASEGAAADLRDVGGRLDGLAVVLEAARGDVAAAREAVGDARAAVADAGGAASSLAGSLDAALGTLGQARGQARTLAGDLSSALGTGAGALADLSSTASHDIGAIAGDVGWAQGRAQAAISQIRAANGTVGGMLGTLESALDELSAAGPSDGAAAALRDRVVEGLRSALSDLERLSADQAAELDELEAASREVASGADAMGNLAGEVNDAVQAGASSLEGLRSQVAQDASPQLSAALDELADAGGRVAGGVSALGPMTGQADGTLAQLDALLAQCDATLGRAASGLRDAAGTAGGLADDLAAVAGASDSAAVSGLLALDPASTGSALGAPVEMASEPVFPVANYGSGVAPFYTNLALWVGGFVLVAVYKLEVDREGLGVAEVSPAQAFFGRWLLLALLGQVQALVCCVGDVALGVQCVSPAAFVLAGMVESLVYVLIVYALAVALKHVGKALGVLLVVLQIPGASGLYPIQMQPDFFRALGPWLPFTYGINAMREAVAGFYDGYYVRNLLVLLAFALPALLLGVAARRRLAGVNALFDRRMAQTDLLIADHPAAWGEKDEGFLASVVDALATSPGHREAFLARAARFDAAYPRLVRRGVAALLAVPLVLLALLFVTPAKFALLVLWVLSLVAASAYLIGVEYAHDRLARMSELERMGTDELVGLVEDMRGGDGR